MKNHDTPYQMIVQEVLGSLAKVRMNAGVWQDSESEETKETQVFKYGECLRPFYLAARDEPQVFRPAPLAAETLLGDTLYVLKGVKRDGFFPSPYSQIPGGTDQYTDFAAFMLEFCTLVNDFWKAEPRQRRAVLAISEEVAQNAFEFLTKPEHMLSDEAGCRWGGTNKYGRVKKASEFFTDTYFTSVVLLSLHRTLEHSLLGLPPARQDQVRQLIRQAGKWIASRFDGKFLTGDEKKTNRRLVHTTWGLRALAETYHTQEPGTRQLLPTIAEAYIGTLRDLLAVETFTPEQEYLTILSDETDAPLYYEDRSGLGGILLALAGLRGLPDLEKLLEGVGYSTMSERVFAALLSLRNASVGLWYDRGLILSIHSYIVEAMLILNRRGTAFGKKLEVSGHMIRGAVRETFSDEVVLASLEQAVYQRLLRVVDAAEQNRTMDEGLEKLVTKTSAPSLAAPKPARRARSSRKAKT